MGRPPDSEKDRHDAADVPNAPRSRLRRGRPESGAVPGYVRPGGGKGRDEMSEPELLPCPFCGGKALINVVPPHKHFMTDLPDYEGGAFVECVSCTCVLSGDTQKEAVKAWNQRVSE